MNHEIRICPKCHYKTSMFYCPKCGEIIKYPSFVGDNNARKETLQSFVRNIVVVAKQQKLDISTSLDNSSLRNAIYRKYYEHIAYLQKLCSNKTTQSYFLNNGNNLMSHIKTFAEKCENAECHIAIVGTVKAGKSMFINALIGQEIASSYPTPETASVTKFRKSEKGNYVKVSFYTSHEWNVLWDSVTASSADSISEDENEDFKSLYKRLNAESIRNEYIDKQEKLYSVKSMEEMKGIVDKFTSARYPEHFFAQEVEIGLSDFFAPSNVVIVDTPGLDDPVPYRTDITRRYLHKANVILLCKRSITPEITASELKHLSYIFAELRYFKDRIITLGTQVDLVQENMTEYWKNYTLPEYLKYFSRSSLYGSLQIANDSIIPITSYYYLLFKKIITSPDVLNDKSSKAKSMKDNLAVFMKRNHDAPSIEELIEEFGQEEAFKRFKSPKQIFDEHQEEFVTMTQIPKVREVIEEKHIRNANDIILNDIKVLYTNLCNEIRKNSNEIKVYRDETIKLSSTTQIKKEILSLESKIKEHKKLQIVQSQQLHKLLSELENKSKYELSKLKSH